MFCLTYRGGIHCFCFKWGEGIHLWSLGVALSLCSEVIPDDAIESHSLQRIKLKTPTCQECAEPIELSISLTPCDYISIEVPINKHKKLIFLVDNIPVGNDEQDPRQNTGVVPSLNPPNFIYHFSPRPSSLSIEPTRVSVGLHTCPCANFPSPVVTVYRWTSQSRESLDIFYFYKFIIFHF